MVELLLKSGLAAGLILAALLGWIRVQGYAREFAARHPEFGPAKEEGSGCGGCACGAGGCKAKRKNPLKTHHQELDA